MRYPVVVESDQDLEVLPLRNSDRLRLRRRSFILGVRGARDDQVRARFQRDTKMSMSVGSALRNRAAAQLRLDKDQRVGVVFNRLRFGSGGDRADLRVPFDAGRAVPSVGGVCVLRVEEYPSLRWAERSLWRPRCCGQAEERQGDQARYCDQACLHRCLLERWQVATWLDCSPILGRFLLQPGFLLNSDHGKRPFAPAAWPSLISRAYLTRAVRVRGLMRSLVMARPSACLTEEIVTELPDSLESVPAI